MDGWRGRIGILLTGQNAVVECEATKMAPEGVSVHFNRMPFPSHSIESMIKFTENVEDAAKLLADCEVNVIALAMTAACVVKKNYNKKLIQRIEKASGVKATTSMTAILEALKKFGAKEVSLGVPYMNPAWDLLKAFMKENGFEVEATSALGIKVGSLINRVSPFMVYKVAKEADRPNVDAVVMATTNLRTIEVIDAIEKDLGKPVVSANQATMWTALRRIGISDPMKGFGKLLEVH